MIAALLLAFVGACLAVTSQPGINWRNVVALALACAALWLMSGGGDRWLQRREQRRR